MFNSLIAISPSRHLAISPSRHLAIRRQEHISSGHVAAFQYLKRLISISMCPMVWQAAGLSYRDLISALIELALEKGRQDAALCRSAELPM